MDEIFSEQAIKDYCFDYDDETNEVKGSCYRKNIPKKLLNGIDIKELLQGNDILFEVNKGYDESLLEEEDPDVFNEIGYSKSMNLRAKGGAHLSNRPFEDLAKQMVDVTENGFVKKQIISHGTGCVVPENSYVTVEYNLYKEGDPVPFDSTYLRNSVQKFRLDQIETILGLFYAVKSMRKNENSRFFIKWEYAFGELGCPDRIEPRCDIMADITLIDFVEVEIEEDQNGLTEEEIFQRSFKKFLNEAKVNHLNGSDQFKKGNIFKAISSYRKSLKILNDMKLADEEEEKAMLKQKAKCLVNLALCYNKIGKYEQACLACQDVLAFDINNVKAYFHYGKASLALSNFTGAKKWLLKAANLKPYDTDINNELKKLNEKKILHEATTKEFWQNAFGKMSINKRNDD